MTKLACTVCLTDHQWTVTRKQRLEIYILVWDMDYWGLLPLITWWLYYHPYGFNHHMFKRSRTAHCYQTGLLYLFWERFMKLWVQLTRWKPRHIFFFLIHPQQGKTFTCSWNDAPTASCSTSWLIAGTAQQPFPETENPILDELQ